MKITNPFVALVIAAVVIGTGVWLYEKRDAVRGSSPESVAALDAVEKRWLDSMRLADLTPRMALPSVVADMQAQRRELDGDAYGNCLHEAVENLQAAMDAAIARTFAFLDTSSVGAGEEIRMEATIGMYTEAYDSLWEQYRTARQACQR